MELEEEMNTPQEDMVTVDLDEDTSGTEMETAAGGDDGTDEGAEESGSGEPEDAQRQQQAQDAEELHRQAVARRAREEAQRAAAHRIEMDAVYAKAYEGVVNPYTNQPIRNEADYKEYMLAKKREAQEMQLSKLEESGVDKNLISQLVQQAVAENPAVQQAAGAVEQANVVMQQAKEKQQRAELAQEMQMIGSLDQKAAAVIDHNDLEKSMDALRDLYPDTWEKTLKYHAAGIPFAEAFQAANLQTLMQDRSAAGKQAAMNAAASKAHLKGMKTNNKTAVTMPREVLEQFRRINPGHTDAEYARFWAAEHKE